VTPANSMNRFFLAVCVFLLALLTLVPAAPADESDLPAPSVGTNTPFQVETDWPGIIYRLIYISRIFDNRLMLIVRIEGTKDAPVDGTLLGTPGPKIPMQASRNSPVKMVQLAPAPLAMTSAVLTDELTKNTFSQLPNKAPPGRGTFPSEVMGKMYPNRMMIFSIQFTVPPPPPPEPDQPPPPAGPQTLSVLLPHAKGPIVHIPLPPPLPPAAKK